MSGRNYIEIYFSEILCRKILYAVAYPCFFFRPPSELLRQALTKLRRRALIFATTVESVDILCEKILPPCREELVETIQTHQSRCAPRNCCSLAHDLRGFEARQLVRFHKQFCTPRYSTLGPLITLPCLLSFQLKEDGGSLGKNRGALEAGESVLQNRGLPSSSLSAETANLLQV
jgi:hypothetical protein